MRFLFLALVLIPLSARAADPMPPVVFAPPQNTPTVAARPAGAAIDVPVRGEVVPAADKAIEAARSGLETLRQQRAEIAALRVEVSECRALLAAKEKALAAMEKSAKATLDKGSHDAEELRRTTLPGPKPKPQPKPTPVTPPPAPQPAPPSAAVQLLKIDKDSPAEITAKYKPLTLPCWIMLADGEEVDGPGQGRTYGPHFTEDQQHDWIRRTQKWYDEIHKTTQGANP